MQEKPGFDDDFQPKRPPFRLPVRSIGMLMVVVGACGLIFAAVAGHGARKTAGRRAVASVPLRFVPVQSRVAPAHDPFVVMAAPEIDVAMVVAAPVGIDEAMVIKPFSGERQSASAAANAVKPALPVPGSPAVEMPRSVYPPEMYAPGQPR